MGRERKNQLGASNLSSRIENSSFGSGSTIKTNEQPSPSRTKVTKSLTRSLIAPDDYTQATKKDKTEYFNHTATWKPAPIHERDFKTDYTISFNDPKKYIEPLAPPKSTYELAEQQLQVKEQRSALDNLCKLIRSTYGTVATMLRSFNKKNTDSFTLYEFNEYIKRNSLETYLPAEQQRLVFDFIESGHSGAVPVKDFLKTVEEHEFRDHEMNKETQKIRDFLAFHVDQRRVEDEETKRVMASSPMSRATLPPIDDELMDAMKKKGIENEAEKIRKALGMRTFDLEIDHKEFNDVLEEVYFKKLPTNEMHRKYARFLHHSNLKLSQVPYYDIRSEELDRLKHRAAMIDRLLESADMSGRYLELSRSRADLLNHRVNNAALLTVTSQEDLKNAVDVNNYDFDKYDDPDTFVGTATPSGATNTSARAGEDTALAQTVTKVLSRPRTSSSALPAEPAAILPEHRSSSPAERFQEEKERMHSRLGLSRSLPNLNLSARPSPLAALDMTDIGKSPNFRDLSGAATNQPPQSKSSIGIANPNPSSQQPLALQVDAPVLNGPSRSSFSPGLRGKKGSHANHQAEESSILSASQKHGVFLSEAKNPGNLAPSSAYSIASLSQQTSANLSKQGSAHTGASASSNTTSKKSKLISELLQPQEGALKETDFYTQVYDESASMGRLKDPSKIVRIEKIDPNVYASKGKRIVKDKEVSDRSRVGMGMGTGSVGEEGGGSSSVDQFQTTYSKYFPPLIYESSQPVSRNLVSEADVAYKQKEFIRNQRYQRTQANLEITRQRIEAEQLEKQMRSLRREASRIEDSIRYKTSVMLNDLYCFKQQPLQRMAKRQNIHLADRMWGGSQEKQTVQLVPENRDFHTTYSASFLPSHSATSAHDSHYSHGDHRHGNGHSHSGDGGGVAAAE